MNTTNKGSENPEKKQHGTYLGGLDENSKYLNGVVEKYSRSNPNYSWEDRILSNQ